MKNFLASEWRRQAAAKRGGGAEVVSIDAADAEDRYRIEPADNRTPEADYQRRWALALIERAVDDVRRAYADRGETELFDALKGTSGRRLRRGRRTASCPDGSAGSKPPSGRRCRGCAPVGGPGCASSSRRRSREIRLVDVELDELVRALAPPS